MKCIWQGGLLPNVEWVLRMRARWFFGVEESWCYCMVVCIV